MIKILHCYANLLNLYGDYANVLALERRLTDAGEQVKVEQLSIDGFASVEDKSFIYIGAGTEKRVLTALGDIRRFKEGLLKYINDGGAMLATGSSAAIFSNKITDVDGVPHEGLGLVSAEYETTSKRYYSDLVLNCSMTDKPVVGVLNTSYRLRSEGEAMFLVKKDSGKVIASAREGLRKGNAFFTLVSGPLLVRNPALLEFYAQLAAGHQLSAPQQDWNRAAQQGYAHSLSMLKEEVK